MPDLPNFKKASRLRLALICGGRSSEREVSLAGAGEIRKALDPARYEVITYDPAIDLERLVKDAGKLDAAFILLHGKFGEDGTIQGLLDLLGLPYQGSGVLGSALAMDKHLSKTIYCQAGIPTPPWVLIEKGKKMSAKEIVSGLGLPVMVKPASQGSSVGMSKVVDVSGMEGAVNEALRWDERVVIEVFMAGREITCGVLGLDDLAPLPIVEICPGEGHGFFDYQAKYKKGASREICPAVLPAEVTKKAQGLALLAHKSLQLSGYSRTDMIISDDGCIYVLETNTVPGMTSTSLFPQEAMAAGIPFGRLLDRLMEMALIAQPRA